MDLPTIWLLIICVEVGLYIILDGADLGIGLLSLLPQEDERRSLLMHTVGPIWDANETWLVIAGGTLFGAFPHAYAILLNALYIPAFIIVIGLIIRAVSFEFRAVSDEKRLWGFAFGFGSLLAVLGQGLAAGAMLSGIAVERGAFAGGPWDWFSPLSLLVAAGITMSYAVAGYAYLIKRRGLEYKHETFRAAFAAATITFLAFAASTVLIPQELAVFYARWTTSPSREILLALTALIGVLSLALVWAVTHRYYYRHLHALCMAIFCAAFAAVVVGAYPYLVPPSLTIYGAAASPATLSFMLWGIGPLLPIIFAYNVYLYRVFRPQQAAEGEEY